MGQYILYCYSSFATKYLGRLNQQQLVQLDHLLNDSDSDWQLYYWITGKHACCIIIYNCAKYIKIPHNTVVYAYMQVVKLPLLNLSVRFCSCYKTIVKHRNTHTINSTTSPSMSSFKNPTVSQEQPTNINNHIIKKLKRRFIL